MIVSFKVGFVLFFGFNSCAFLKTLITKPFFLSFLFLTSKLFSFPYFSMKKHSPTYAMQKSLIPVTVQSIRPLFSILIVFNKIPFCCSLLCWLGQQFLTSISCVLFKYSTVYLMLLLDNQLRISFFASIF